MPKSAGRSPPSPSNVRSASQLLPDGTNAAAVLDELADKFYRAGPDGRLAFIGSGVARLLGFEPGELIGRPMSDAWVNPAERVEMIAALERQGGFDERSVAIRRRDGTILTSLITCRVLRDASGETCGYIGKVVDLTAGLEAKIALAESRAQLTAVLDSMEHLVWSVDAVDFGLLTYNQRCADYFKDVRGIVLKRGLLPEQMLPAGPFVEVWYEMFARAATGERFTTDYVTYTGTTTLRITFTPLYRGDALFAISVFGQDITDRLKADEELRASEERFNKAFNANPSPMVIVSMDKMEVLEANQSALELFEYPSEEVIGKSSFDLGVQSDPERPKQLQQTLLRDGRFRDLPLKYRSKSGRELSVLASAEVMEVRGRLCVLFALDDRTEYQGLQEQFLQAQKMEAVGRLAGGVAHDFNNLLTVIVGRSDWLVTDLPEGELQMQAREILHAGQRATELTEQLLALSRNQTPQPFPLRLSDVLIDHERMVRRLVGEDVRCEIKIAPDLGAVLSNTGQIHQVLLNLVVNARDAMPTGGRITIDAHNEDLDTAAAGALGVKRGPYVVLSVTDTGAGMDDATRARVFEPFFTTKSAGKGTGLGLPTVQRIISQAGGGIRLESVVGQGTTFSLYFPRTEVAVRDSGAHGVQDVAGTETILLIEDQDDLRRFASSALSHYGYAVIEASNGLRALDLARSHSGRIDFIVSDVVLVDMRGPEIVDRIRRERADVSALFVSGFTEVEPGADWILREGDGYLQKPFTMAALAGRVRELIDSAAKR